MSIVFARRERPGEYRRHSRAIGYTLDHNVMRLYRINIMAKRAISVTLDADNLMWLKARTGAARLRSVSELLDQLVTVARESGRIGPSQSVVGTIDIDASDPLLEGADDAVRVMFETSLGRPLMVKEATVEYRVAPRKKRRG